MKLLVAVVSFLLPLAAFCKQPATQTSEGYISVHGASLYYKILGSGEPVLVIHGGPGLNHDYMYPYLGSMAGNYKLIFYDQRACGRSKNDSNAAPLTLDTLVNDIELIRKHFNISRLNIMAHSFGGILAMKYAIKYPGNMKSLVLVSSIGASSATNNEANKVTASRLTKEDNEQRKAIIASGDFKAHDPKAFERLMMIGFKHSLYDPQKIGALHLNLPADFYENSMKLQNLAGDLTEYDFYNELKAIACPVLLIYGESDPLTDHVAGPLEKSIPNARLVTIARCGHFPFIEAKERFTAIATDFLKDNRDK